jgi:ribonuclease E
VPIPPGHEAAEAGAEGEGRDGGRRRRRRGGRDRGEGRAGEEGQQNLLSDSADAGAAPAVNGTDQAADAAPAERTDGDRPEGDRPDGERADGERSRRRRGGRGRGRDREGAEAGAEGADRAEGAAVAEGAPAAPAPSAAATPDADAPQAQPAVAEAAPVVTPAPAPAPAPAAAPAPRAARAEPIRIEPYLLPTEALASLATQAGLDWVQSDADKIAAVRAAMAAEPAPVRAPREPKRHVLVDDGPLVLVETRKDLSQLKLPFDQAAG